MEVRFRTLTTKEKALAINLDTHIYGSFAEIGAGQEVAANFFKAGGASGTIAKTMSAYDMSFSDAIYGKCDRYVCEDRLMQMLDKEYSLLPKRLPERAPSTRFFAFANTVEALNYKKTNQGHGWLGLRFQLTPETEPNECVIHIMLHDNDALLQQQALGVVGVNLLYGCFMYENPEEILNSLRDGINEGRMDVDMFRISGPDFKHVDNRLMALKLVKNGLSKAAMFGPDGTILQPSEALYKRNALVLRGRFRPVTHVNTDMLNTGLEMFEQDPEVEMDNIRVLCELTLNDLKAGADDIDDKDFLYRAELLAGMGVNVLISNYQRHYRLVEYLSRFTRGRKIGIILGVHNLEKIFDESYYKDLRGGVLESFGVLFGNNVKLYVYPARDSQTAEIITLENMILPDHLKNLFLYLKDNGKLVDLENINEEVLDIISDNVLDMIRRAEDGWEDYVPWLVADAIKAHCLFDYPCEVMPDGTIRKKAIPES